MVSSQGKGCGQRENTSVGGVGEKGREEGAEEETPSWSEGEPHPREKEGGEETPILGRGDPSLGRRPQSGEEEGERRPNLGRRRRGDPNLGRRMGRGDPNLERRRPQLGEEEETLVRGGGKRSAPQPCSQPGLRAGVRLQAAVRVVQSHHGLQRRLQPGLRPRRK